MLTESLSKVKFIFETWSQTFNQIGRNWFVSPYLIDKYGSQHGFYYVLRVRDGLKIYF